MKVGWPMSGRDSLSAQPPLLIIFFTKSNNTKSRFSLLSLEKLRMKPAIKKLD